MFLPRKFKTAFADGSKDRAAIRFYDIGARARKSEDGQLGFGFLLVAAWDTPP